MVTAVTVSVALKETAENLAVSVFMLNFATLNETKNKIGYV
jgi:hypothetical protein